MNIRSFQDFHKTFYAFGLAFICLWKQSYYRCSNDTALFVSLVNAVAVAQSDAESREIK